MYFQNLLSSYDKLLTLFAANGFKYKKIGNNRCTITQNYNELNKFMISLKPICRNGGFNYCWEIKIPVGEKNVSYVTYFDLDQINDIKKYLLYHMKRVVLKNYKTVRGMDYFVYLNLPLLNDNNITSI